MRHLCRDCNAEVAFAQFHLDLSGAIYCHDCWLKRNPPAPSPAPEPEPMIETRAAAAPVPAPAAKGVNGKRKSKSKSASAKQNSAPASKKNPVPPQDAELPAPRLFTCLYCRKPIRDADVVFFGGETACARCHKKQAARAATLTEKCHHCGKKSPLETITQFKDHPLCPDCFEHKRIQHNTQMKSHRQSLQSSRTVRPHVSGRAAWIITIVATLVVAGIVITIAAIAARGVEQTAKPATVTYVQPDGKLLSLPRDAALKRLAKEFEGRVIDPSGNKLSHDESLNFVRD